MVLAGRLGAQLSQSDPGGQGGDGGADPGPSGARSMPPVRHAGALPASLAVRRAMQLIRERRIDGIFEGYRGGRVYRLADGSRWRQEDATSEYAYRERPKARLLRDGTGRLTDGSAGGRFDTT
jgi:hypothetical protein